MSGRKCKLTRLTDNGHTRTKEMVGWSDVEPTTGFAFIILNDQPLDRSKGATMRAITTSAVRETRTESDGSVRFRTLNTDYLLEYLAEEA